MAQSLIPSLPGFDEPIEMLRACHDRMVDQCNTLKRLVPHLEANGCDESARQAAAAVLRYFTLAGPHHHMDEEHDLFPLLLEHAVGEDAQRAALLVASMLADHREMERLWALLGPLLQSVETGATDRLDPVLVTAFCALYGNHIAIEENDVLALAEHVLPQASLAHVGRAMSVRRGVPVADLAS